MSMLLVLNAIFSGTILGVLAATAGSTLISLYLLYKPVKLLNEPQFSEASLKQFKEDLAEILK